MEQQYKDTPIGKIPNDWNVMKLGDVFDFIPTKSYSRAQLNYDREGISYVHYGDIHSTFKFPLVNLNTTELPKINSDIEINGNINYLKEGDLILADASEDLEGVGKCIEVTNIGNKKVIGGLHTIVLRDKLNCTGKGFRPYILASTTLTELRKIATGASVLGVSKSNLQGVNILIPPQPEQEKIAEVLSTVDNKIDAIGVEIGEVERLKKGLMQKLLTQGVGHTEFKDSPLGQIPKEWGIVKLGEVADIERGKFQHRPRNDPKYYGGDYPYIQTGDIARSNGKILNYTQSLNELGLSVSKLFPRGTVVITIAANIGDTAIAEFDVAFPDSLIGIKTGNTLNNIFIRYYLVTQKSELNKLATVSAQKNINLETLKPYKITLPPLAEQKQIVEILSTVDEKLDVLRDKKDSYSQLKKGLMQQLLTGKIRIKA